VALKKRKNSKDGIKNFQKSKGARGEEKPEKDLGGILLNRWRKK